jgi:hypothetical protein
MKKIFLNISVSNRLDTMKWNNLFEYLNFEPENFWTSKEHINQYETELEIQGKNV